MKAYREEDEQATIDEMDEAWFESEGEKQSPIKRATDGKRKWRTRTESKHEERQAEESKSAIQALPEPNIIDLTEDDREEQKIKNEILEKQRESKRRHNPQGLLVCLPLACKCCKKVKKPIEGSSI